MRSLKVLILVPNPFQLMSLHQMLNAIGIYDVLTASSLASALSSLGHRGEVDLAIFDPHHRNAEGLHLMRHLARHGQARALIFLEAGVPTLFTDRDTALLQQAFMLQRRLHVPVSPVLLRTVLDQYLAAIAQPAEV